MPAVLSAIQKPRRRAEARAVGPPLGKEGEIVSDTPEVRTQMDFQRAAKVLIAYVRPGEDLGRPAYAVGTLIQRELAEDVLSGAGRDALRHFYTEAKRRLVALLSPEERYQWEKPEGWEVKLIDAATLGLHDLARELWTAKEKP